MADNITNIKTITKKELNSFTLVLAMDGDWGGQMQYENKRINAGICIFTPMKKGHTMETGGYGKQRTTFYFLDDPKTEYKTKAEFEAALKERGFVISDSPQKEDG